MKPEVLNKLNNVLDEILSEFEKDHLFIFDNESERKSEHYRLVNKELKSWNNRKKCIFRNCTNKSIRRSHSIQKSGPLMEVAKDSRVLTPEFNEKTGKVELVVKGLAKASTFPGFCEEHEGLFSSFENSKSTANIEGLPLQIYRSICREIVRLKHESAFGLRSISEYKKFRDKKLKRIFEEKLGANWILENNVKLNKFKFRDSLVDYIRKRHIELKDTVEELENQHLREIEECLKINDENSEGTLNAVSISIDCQIPVALSGIGSFCITKGNHSKQVHVVLLVLPDANGTTIVIHSKSSDEKNLHGYLSRLKNSFDILNMVEQWMIRCTDHWFLSHDVWEQKKQAERAAILQEILDDTKGLADELNFSIFDDIRRSMIKTWKTTGNTKEQLEILSREQAKLRN